MSVIIKGGTVVNADQSFRADVYCDDGIIQAVGPDMDAPLGVDVVDAGGCYVMPGGIDPHTTCNSRSWEQLLQKTSFQEQQQARLAEPQ